MILMNLFYKAIFLVKIQILLILAFSKGITFFWLADWKWVSNINPLKLLILLISFFNLLFYLEYFLHFILYWIFHLFVLSLYLTKQDWTYFVFSLWKDLLWNVAQKEEKSTTILLNSFYNLVTKTFLKSNLLCIY